MSESFQKIVLNLANKVLFVGTHNFSFAICINSCP